MQQSSSASQAHKVHLHHHTNTFSTSTSEAQPPLFLHPLSTSHIKVRPEGRVQKSPYRNPHWSSATYGSLFLRPFRRRLFKEGKSTIPSAPFDVAPCDAFACLFVFFLLLLLFQGDDRKNTSTKTAVGWCTSICNKSCMTRSIIITS